MSDVAAICLRVLLDLGGPHGIAPATLLDGLGIDERELRASVRRRYRWDEYTTMLDRLAVALGGFDELARAAAGLPEAMPEGAALCSVFLSPRAVYRFVLEVLDAAVLPMVEFELYDVGGDRLRIVQRVTEGFRGSLAFQHGSAGAMLAVPGYIGLRPSKLGSLSITPRVLDMTVTVPASQTAFARLRRLVPRLFPRQAISEMRDDKIELAKTFVELRASERKLDETRAALTVESERREALERAISEERPSIDVDKHLERAAAQWHLTPRQIDVLRGLIDGLSNADIAERLGCAVRTVETHLTQILQRADAQSRLELVSAFWADLV